MGLKENVIIGKLIPTGTGLKKYQDITINTDLNQTMGDEFEEAMEDDDM